MSMILLIAIGITALSFATTAVAAPILAARARRRGAMDRPGGRKTQPAAIPYGGGLATYLGFWAPLFVGAVMIAVEMIRPGSLPDVIAVHVPGLLSKAKEIAAVLVAATAMLCMGRRDDRAPMSVMVRLLLQIGAGFLIALSGLRATVFSDLPAVHYAVTVFWVVLVMNAANFIDNMDGLMGGVLTASALGLAVIAGASGQLFVAAFALALAGALAGFLVFNSAPASIYIGDEGSMFTGSLMAALSLAISYRGKGGFDEAPYVVFSAPLLVLFVPLADAAVAIGGRLLRGVSPATAGRDHLSHRLVARGLSPRRAVACLIALSFATNGLALLLYARHRACFIAAAVFCAAAFVVAIAVGRTKAPAPSAGERSP